LDLTHDELAKEHIRHMVGGHSTLAENERLLRFVFPERPGALMKFLSLMRPGWNISLFHYRNQGAIMVAFWSVCKCPRPTTRPLPSFCRR
jgi:threonine dehydratase